MTPIQKAAEEIRQVSEARQLAREAINAFDARVERVTMHILGKKTDPARGVNWHCDRYWQVNDVRQLVREALKAEKAPE